MAEPTHVTISAAEHTALGTLRLAAVRARHQLAGSDDTADRHQAALLAEALADVDRANQTRGTDPCTTST